MCKHNNNFDLLPAIRKNFKALRLVGPNREEDRRVYVSGFYFALVIAMAYEESGRPELGVDFWNYLTKCHSPEPAVDEFVKTINYLSGNKLKIESSNVPNPAYRYGVYGSLFVKGVEDGLFISLRQIPGLIMKGSCFGNRAKVTEWISQQMQILSPPPVGEDGKKILPFT